MAIAATTVLLVLAGRRVVHRMFPGALIAVGGSLVVSRMTGYDGPVVGNVPTDLPTLSLDLLGLDRLAAGRWHPHRPGGLRRAGLHRPGVRRG